MKDVVVVGAGLSGLTAASRLAARGRAVLVLEGLDRVGGRLARAAGGRVDLGGSWHWPPGDVRVGALVSRLGATVVPQVTDRGGFAAEDGEGRARGDELGAAGVRGGDVAPCGRGAVRVRDGAASLAEALRTECEGEGVAFRCGTRAVGVAGGGAGGGVTVTTDAGEEIPARTVVLAAPPRVLLDTIVFSPPLPESQMQAMRDTPTWMAEVSKVAVGCSRRFWREIGHSGVAVSRAGPVESWWEAGASGDDDSGGGEGEAALAGFVSGRASAGLAGLSAAALRERVVAQLARLFPGAGDVGAAVEWVELKTWADCPLTHARPPRGAGRPWRDGPLGAPEARAPALGGRCFFAGTETCAEGRGHMEGAVAAGERAAAEVEGTLARAGGDKPLR